MKEKKEPEKMEIDEATKKRAFIEAIRAASYAQEGIVNHILALQTCAINLFNIGDKARAAAIGRYVSVMFSAGAAFVKALEGSPEAEKKDEPKA